MKQKSTQAKPPKTKGRSKPIESKSVNRFEPVKLDPLFVALDAIAWMDTPSSGQIAQFAGIEPRTAGKLLKNAYQIGLIEAIGTGYALTRPYPYKGSQAQKQAVVKESLVKLPLLTSLRQFKRLGDSTEVALRKSATISGLTPFVPSDLNPLLEWAQSLGALESNILAEDLIDEAETQKINRHKDSDGKIVAFLSHSSVDKPFIRQVAADLTANGIGVWIDEQRIRVGDSIPDKIGQGLAESDFFLIALSQKSIESPWVQKELNNALMTEVKRRKVHVLPLLLDDCSIPSIISDKKYADFSKSYKSGMSDLLAAMKGAN